MFLPHVINARNVEDAFSTGVNLMRQPHVVRGESRNGPVSVWPGPVITHTARPLERVLFNPLRKANPFFHLMESLWMLAGRDDLPWLAYFNKRMAEYSDDGGKTQPAAYGFRWRNFFGYDQIDAIVEELRRNPQTRRCVLAMWDGGGDKGGTNPDDWGDLSRAIVGSADVPCNTQCYFTIDADGLHMGVTCRSNDLVWGAHGANAVHFSVLQEYIAARVGVPVGTMTQFSWNYHLYDGVLKARLEDVVGAYRDHYRFGLVATTPLFHADTMDLWEEELPTFMDWADPRNQGIDMKRRFRSPPQFKHQFLNGVAEPMLRTWDFYKAADLEGAANFAHSIARGSDWQRAAVEWTNRRLGVPESRIRDMGAL